MGGFCHGEAGQCSDESCEGQGDDLLAHGSLLMSLEMQMRLDCAAYGPCRGHRTCAPKRCGGCLPVRAQGYHPYIASVQLGCEGGVNFGVLHVVRAGHVFFSLVGTAILEHCDNYVREVE